jgi:HlyD family secretion protein
MSDIALGAGKALDVPGGKALAERRDTAPARLPDGRLPDGRPGPELLLDAPRPRTSGTLMVGTLSLLLFVGGFGAWSFMAPLSEAAIAPGVIKSEGNRRTVQHLEGGIVREILVKDGDVVKAGQVLMRLDDIAADSTLEALRLQRWSLLAQVSRLESELGRARDVTFPADLMAATDPRAQEAVLGQRALFAIRQTSLQSQLNVLANRVDQQQAALTSADAQRVSQERQLVLIRREETDVRTLVAQGLERMPRLLGLQRNVASLEGNMADLSAQAVKANAAIAEARSQMRQIEDQRMQESSTELRDARGKLNDVEERIRAARDVATRREITAPEDGTILHSRFFNLGAVIRAGEPVMELVPTRDRLIAEVQLAPTDIDVVYPGLLTEVRLPAFKQRLVPYLHGHVTNVASDITQDERRGNSYYTVRVQIDEAQLKALEGVELRPGMPVEAQIQVGERSFFRYMMQPLIDSFHRAFKEQ